MRCIGDEMGQIEGAKRICSLTIELDDRVIRFYRAGELNIRPDLSQGMEFKGFSLCDHAHLNGRAFDILQSRTRV